MSHFKKDIGSQNGPAHLCFHHHNRKAEITLDGHKQVIHDEFMSRGGLSRAGFQLKWLASTTITGTIGILGILVAVYTSMDTTKNKSIMQVLQDQGQKSFEIFRPTVHAELTSSNKEDREISKGESIAYTIHDSEIQERNGREFIATKPYVKVVGKLATYNTNSKLAVPAFDPYKLYANLKPLTSSNSKDKVKKSAITTSIINFSPLLHRYAYRNSPLHSMTVNKITTQTGNSLLQKTAFRPAMLQPNSELSSKPYEDDIPDRETPLAQNSLLDDKDLAHTTTIAKNSPAKNIVEKAIEKIVTVKSGETFTGILNRAGISKAQRLAVLKAMTPIYPAHKIKIGQQLHFTLLPALSTGQPVELVKISLHNKSNTRHLVSVAINDKGKYVASKKIVPTIYLGNQRIVRSQKTTLYKSIYESAVVLHLPSKEIMRLLRIHAFETDYKKPPRPGDNFQAFYAATKDKSLGQDRITDLLYTAISTQGEVRSYYRFRLPDGSIDYYDKDGKSAQKFLLLKPVRTARLTSGFGYRWHPILKRKKLHQGIDWAGVPIGTPILAAGNGTVEVARPAGGYGNYVRIRHANGYKTSYAHMVRFAKGMKKGIKVRQGQVIGYLGSTGRSTGPHLHFEVLVNNKRVNPMAIHVPSGKNLSGKLAVAFQAERRRIDSLMKKSPVKTKIASAE